MMPNMSNNDKMGLGWDGVTVSSKEFTGSVIVHLALEIVEPLLDQILT